jgi:hypothetical protein
MNENSPGIQSWVETAKQRAVPKGRLTDSAVPSELGIRRIPRKPTHWATFFSPFARRVLPLISFVIVLLALAARAETSTNSAATELEPAEKAWSFGASIYGYIVPESREYVQPTLSADHKLLHLEARYNYEDIDTGSVWVGCNFGAGERVAWTFTPMLGGVFGHTTGIAPGYKGSVGWWKLELYSEGEYLVDTGNSHNNFFYNWSELTISPLDWFKIGMVTQRTRLYRTDRDVQRGVLAGLMFKHMDFTTYVLNPDESKPTVVLAAAFHF